MLKLIGPFTQILTLENLPLKGDIKDEALVVKHQAGILISEGKIAQINSFETLKKDFPNAEIEEILEPSVVLPNFVDCHTHICFAGNRASDFAMRNAGIPYLEIAQQGGGIASSVKHIRESSEEELIKNTLKRINRHLENGISTIEIKSGYGLNRESELKMLSAIQKASEKTFATLIPTCLSAHIKPKDFVGNSEEYLNFILTEILPEVKSQKLAKRVDIFIEQSAFLPEESKNYLLKAKEMGFDITVHADQFTSGGSKIAVEIGALSADHLEHSTDEDLQRLAQSNTIAVALPGASIGLGEPFTPARKLLDYGGSLAIASDWNPGSAPQGNLLMQASVLATFQKLSTAEVFAGITFRAAKALNLEDRGILEHGKLADFHSYPTSDYRDILYHQGMITPNKVWVNGDLNNMS